jgi:hypothetical protein
LERLLRDVFSWGRRLLSWGGEGDGLAYPPALDYGSHPPTEGTGPTYKTSSGLVVVMVGVVHQGEGSVPRHCYLMEGLSSFVPTYGILHILNGFLSSGAYPLAAS